MAIGFGSSFQHDFGKGIFEYLKGWGFRGRDTSERGSKSAQASSPPVSFFSPYISTSFLFPSFLAPRCILYTAHPKKEGNKDVTPSNYPSTTLCASRSFSSPFQPNHEP